MLARDSEFPGALPDPVKSAFAPGVTDFTGTGGDDTLDLSAGLPPMGSDFRPDLADGGAGDDSITTAHDGAIAFGGAGDDTLLGQGLFDTLYGGEGADLVQGDLGKELLDGGTGGDTILGGAGKDTLLGGEHGPDQSAGDDMIDGGNGNDVIRGGHGADSLIGGAGADVVDHLGLAAEDPTGQSTQFSQHVSGDADTLDGGSGNDTLIFDRHDLVTGGLGNDEFWLYHDQTDGMDVAEVTDFRPGSDVLKVSLNPNAGATDPPVVETAASPDGADGLVFVNGDLVAVLRGAPNVTSGDIFASVEPDQFL